MDAEFNDQGIFENNSTNSNLANKDAFFRNRVSEPFTIFDSQNRYRENGKFSYAYGSGGSSTYLENESAVSITVNGTSGAYVYRESKRVMAYQPGKSFLIMQTFAFSTPLAGLRQRIGLFGTNNGVYLEQDETTLYLVLRSYVSGTVDNSRKVAQKDWNGHKFNGSTFYQRNLDITKANIFWMDIEWLGVGDVRCGFIVDGVPIVAHTFHNDNLNPTTYMTTAVLPLRQEIENTGTTNVTSDMRVICSTVISEGGYQARATNNHAATTIVANDAKSLSTPGTFYPMISMKLKSTRLDAVVLPDQVDLIALSNDNLQWRLVLNPTFIGTTSFTNYSTDSSVQIDTAGTSYTGGTTIAGGVVYQKSEASLGGIENFNFQLGRTIQGTSDILTLAVTGSANTAKCTAGLGWQELI
jgi:hypothetical protein